MTDFVAPNGDYRAEELARTMREYETCTRILYSPEADPHYPTLCGEPAITETFNRHTGATIKRKCEIHAEEPAYLQKHAEVIE